MRHCLAVAVILAGAAPALAAPPTNVSLPAAPRPAPEFRLKPITAPSDPTFRIDDPRSRFSTGYGGSLVNLFPFAGGNFHFSAGPRLFGRAGRPHLVTPESQSLLPAFRMPGGMRASRRLSPAMLIGYGRPVDQGFAWGLDAGVMKGKISPMPDRVGHLNRSRVDEDLTRSHSSSEGINELVRMTALYRF